MLRLSAVADIAKFFTKRNPVKADLYNLTDSMVDEKAGCAHHVRSEEVNKMTRLMACMAMMLSGCVVTAGISIKQSSGESTRIEV